MECLGEYSILISQLGDRSSEIYGIQAPQFRPPRFQSHGPE